MSTEPNPSNPKSKTRAVGVAANIWFLIFLLFPFDTVNGATMRPSMQYYILIWIAAIATLYLRIKRKEKAALIASCLSTVICIIVYAELAISNRKAVGLLNTLFSEASNKAEIHIITALLLLASSVIMIKPSLVGDKL